MHSTSTLARSRRRARARLNALARAAGLGGVALAALAPGAQAAPVAPAPAAPADDLHLRPPAPDVLDRPVRAATPHAARVLGAAGSQRPAVPTFANRGDAFGLGDVGDYASPAISDLDGDGDLDILTGEAYGSFVYFENTGTATAPVFANRGDAFGLGDVGDYTSPAISDLDGDGDLDILTGKAYGSFVYFENTGTATAPVFANRGDVLGLGNIGYYSTPSVDDLDGDGDLDVLAGERSGAFVYFENTGTATAPVFANRGDVLGLGDIGYYSTPSVDDLDGDGDLDILTGEAYGSFVYFENTGTATAPVFANRGDALGLGDIGNESKTATGDLDGDGDLDILAGRGSGEFVYFESTDGAGAAPQFAAPQTNPFGLANIGYASEPSLADLDGDGDLDVLSGDFNGTFRYFENTGTVGAPAFASLQTSPFGLDVVEGRNSAPSVVDLDGDGDLDVLSGARDGVFVYFENTGTASAPTFASPQTNPFGLVDIGTLSRPSVADLDGDGDLDVLAGNNDGTFRYFENTGTASAPAFASPQTNPFGLVDIGSNGSASAPSVADLDLDGDLDVLSGISGGDFRYFENTGTASAPAFALQQANPFGLTDIGVQSKPAVADLDGDGDADVLAGEYYGSFFYFQNNAPPPPPPPPVGSQTPAFSAAQPLPFGLPDLGDAATYTEGDLDGDGDLDLVAGDNNGAGASDGALYYFENTGTATAPAYTQRAPASVGLDDTAGLGRVLTPDLGDVDGDGDLDLMVGDADGDYGYYENAGTAAAPAFVNRGNLFGFPDRGGNATVELADFDGDGDTDALLGSRDNGGGGFRTTNLVLLDNTGGPDGPPAFAAPVTNPFGLPTLNEYHADPAVADLDGDGDLDLVVGTYYDSKTIYFENTAGPGVPPAFAGGATNAFGLDPSGNLTSPLLADLDGDGDLDALVGLADGTAEFFENDPAGTPGATASVTGDEGYRMLSAPADGATVDMLLGTTHTQGFPGADAENGQPNVYLYDESLPGASAFGYRTPTSQDEAIGLGRGLFAYLFEDDDASTPEVDGGFPKPLRVAGERPLVDFGWGADGPGLLTFTDTGDADADGFNLLGNPFGSWFDWDAVELTNVDAPVYVYDDAVANYRTYSQAAGAGSLPGGVVGPFQGFWVKANGASPGLTARAAVSNGGPLYRAGAAPTAIGLRLRPAEGAPLPEGVEAEAFAVFGVAGAEAGRDRADAVALASLAPASLALAVGDGLAIDARPEIGAETTVELAVAATGAEGAVELVLDWPGLALPDGWTARLVDRETGAETALADGGAYAFSLAGTAARDAFAAPALRPARAAGLTEGRFALVVTPAGVVAGETAPTAVALSPVMPNPARGTARLALTLASPERVRAAVYDALGREVAVLADGEMQGAAELRIDTARLAAGVYVVRVEGETFAETRRLTVVR